MHLVADGTANRLTAEVKREDSAFGFIRNLKLICVVILTHSFCKKYVSESVRCQENTNYCLRAFLTRLYDSKPVEQQIPVKAS